MPIAYLEVVRRKRCQIILVILQISSRNFVKVVPKNDLLMKIQLVAFITSLLLGGLKVGSLWVLQSWMLVKLLYANLMCLPQWWVNIYNEKFCLTISKDLHAVLMELVFRPKP